MKWHLAEQNVAKMRFAADAPEMQDFNNALDMVNAAADTAEGFVWRYRTETEADQQEEARVFGADLLVNLSVWRDDQALRKYVASKPHIPVMKRRAEWFAPMDEYHLVLWWVPAGHIPPLEEAHERWQLINENGPEQDAFGFGQIFERPD